MKTRTTTLAHTLCDGALIGKIGTGVTLTYERGKYLVRGPFRKIECPTLYRARREFYRAVGY